MPALATATQARLSTQRLVELTNPDNSTATTVNVALLETAETDAMNDFVFRTGILFVLTDSEHLTVGVKGVVAFLYSYRGLPRSTPGEAAEKEWEEACSRFARTRGALAWQSPRTNSVLQPSLEPSNNRPYFDRENMDLIPRPPGFGNVDDSEVSQ